MNRLADVAKHLVEPDGALSTGWPKVRDTCLNLGWAFDDWQDDLGRLILAKDSSGQFVATLCAMSLPRQVGKTYLVGCLAFAVCLTKPGTTAIWTAHRSRTATETFRVMKAKAKSPELAAFIDQRAKGGGIRSANGEQEIEFLNGSRILFGAREGGFGVGFSDVGMLVLDEIQRANTKTMDDLLPTTNAADNPLVLCMGTPPRPTDAGEVFTMLRTEAIRGDSSDVLYVELGASERFDLNDDAEFWRQLRRVNPAFPHRVGERAILRNKKGLTDDSVFREVFGLWDEVGANAAVIPTALWETLEADGPSDGIAPAAMAVDASHDGIPVVAACWRLDEQSHVELLGAGEVDDEALADWIAEKATHKMPVVIDSASPAARLIPLLQTRRVNVITGSSMAMSKACGGLYAAVVAGLLTWGGPNGFVIGRALAAAGKRKIGDAGGWGWDRRDPASNISPLVAVTLAHYGASNAKKRGSGRSTDGRKGTSL
jgi:hypothetical protein